jgi:hypothetical protein
MSKNEHRFIHPSRLLCATFLGLGLASACSEGPSGEALIVSGVPHDSKPSDGSGGHGGSEDGTPNFDPCASCADDHNCNEEGQCVPAELCAQNADCPADLHCETSTGVCVASEQCGEVTISSSPVERNIFIVLDRSCSMTNKIDGTTKWAAAVAAVSGFVGKKTDLVHFGLELFPSVGKCGQQDVAVPLSATGSGEISALLSAALNKSDPQHPKHGPCRTPTAAAMDLAAEQEFIDDSDRKGFILLITDGKTFPCNKNNVEAANLSIRDTIQQLAARSEHPVQTLVVGFGSKIDSLALNDWAEAGGMPATDGDDKFYSAQSPAALHETLATIATKTASCEHALAQEAPHADRISVYFNGDLLVARDETHSDGWDYDNATNRLRFFGAACDALQQGDVDDVDIVFGCPPDAPK